MRKSLMATTALAATALLGMAGPALAGYTHTESFSLSVDLTAGSPANLNLQKFDTTKGNLQSILVTETFSGAIKGNVKAANTGAPTSGAIGFSSALTVSGGPSALDGSPLLSIAIAQTVNTVTTGAAETYSTNTARHKSPTISNFAAWENAGGGTTALTLLASMSTLSKPAGWNITGNSTDLKFILSGNFTYTNNIPDSVPEPASALMLGAGLLALGGARRRRKRQ